MCRSITYIIEDYRYRIRYSTNSTMCSNFSRHTTLLQCNYAEQLRVNYCGINRIRGSSITVVFSGSPLPGVHNFNKNKFRKNYYQYWNWKPKHPRIIFPGISKIPILNENWPPKLNHSTVMQYFDAFFLQFKFLYSDEIFRSWCTLLYTV